MQAPDETQRAAYYQAALRGLQFVEQRLPTNRRFGVDADARWAALRGHLTTADRIDLLLRDADAQWPAAFGARTVFRLRAVAEDEPFGAEWTPLDPVDAEALWRSTLASPAPPGVREALQGCAAAWGIALCPMDAGGIGAADKLFVVGPSAVAAAASAFAGDPDLDWVNQVACVATPHAHRQVAALAAVLATRPAMLVAPATIVTHEIELAAAKPSGTGKVLSFVGRRLVVSEDADAGDVAWARQAVGG